LSEGVSERNDVASKANVLSRIKQGESFPISSIGDINWFVNQAAIL